MALDLDRLEVLSRTAADDPWGCHPNELANLSIFADAMTPQTALALIAEVRRLQERLREQQVAIENMRQALQAAANQKIAIEKLRSALEFYARDGSYVPDEYGDVDVEYDRGNKARLAVATLEAPVSNAAYWDGKALPSIGCDVLFDTASSDEQVGTVTGFHVHPDLNGDTTLHCVVVDLVYKGTTTTNCRLLRDLRPLPAALKGDK